MLTQTTKRLVAATFAGGVLAVSPMALPAAQAAPAVGCPNYSVASTTTTTVTTTPAGNLQPGTTFTATATVTVDANGQAAQGGTVTFRYVGQRKDAAVTGGTASVQYVSKQGRPPVIASYNGQCLAGVSNGTSEGRQPVVAGVSATRGGGGGNGDDRDPTVAGVSAGRGGVVAGLAATGLDSQTELFGVLGIGLVTVGGLTLLVHRRRVQA
jgi:LPXTG-motif cell wall-anchored protein